MLACWPRPASGAIVANSQRRLASRRPRLQVSPSVLRSRSAFIAFASASQPRARPSGCSAATRGDASPRRISPIRCVGAVDMHRLQIGAAADGLARLAARLLEQHAKRAARRSLRLKRVAAARPAVPAGLQPRGLHVFRNLLAQAAAGVPGRGLYLNEKACA